MTDEQLKEVEELSEQAQSLSDDVHEWCALLSSDEEHLRAWADSWDDMDLKAFAGFLEHALQIAHEALRRRAAAAA
jgi:FtsZ-binding cell division protein ZapB